MEQLSGYEFNVEIHRGIRTKIFRAKRLNDNLPVIIKMHSDEYPSKRDIERFLWEFRIAQELNDDQIIKYYAIESLHHGYALIEEDISGVPMSQAIPKAGYASESFLKLAIQMADGLNAVHKNKIIHKDIKPSNFIIRPDKEIVKLVDFGISSRVEHEVCDLINLNTYAGTLFYLSPEQTGRMNRILDYRTDFYSLGVSFYEMLCGFRPFDSDNKMELIHCHIAKQPIPLHETTHEIPRAISNIVMKLLSKNAEDRYQSALGLRIDLEKCLKELGTCEKITPFELGQKDFSDKFSIPEKQYGRENEIKNILEIFERVSTGTPEILLISGQSGIGKSVLINELNKPLTTREGYFISGKFNQLKQTVPYSAFVQAFQALARQMITEPKNRIEEWKQKIIEAIDPNGQVIIDLIPAMANIIGPQPNLSALPPTESHNRFVYVIQQFIKTFAQPGHPLVLFIDNLQYADLTFTKLLQGILMEDDLRSFLLIGGFRENEVTENHPLMCMIKELKEKNIRYESITLKPLDNHHVCQLISDTFSIPVEAAEPLSMVINNKTGGNPAYIKEFIKNLYDKGIIFFDADRQIWQWDIKQIDGMRATDNVVDFLIEQMNDFSEETQQCLSLAACMGNQFDLATLSILRHESVTNTINTLLPAIEKGLVLGKLKLNHGDGAKMLNGATLVDTSYLEFHHSRIQQVAYEDLKDELRKQVHLQIGRIMLKNKDHYHEELFNITAHLNLGVDLITDSSERELLIESNLRAGKKARVSGAYKLSLQYMEAGLSLLGENKWEQQYHHTLSLYTEKSRILYLMGDLGECEKLSDIVLSNAKTVLDKIEGYELKIFVYMSQNKMQESLETAREILKMLGIKLPLKPTKLHIISEYIRTQLLLKTKSEANLINLPEMTTPHKSACMRILSVAISPAFLTVPELFPIIIFKEMNLSLKHGYAPVSPFAYINYGTIQCAIMGNIDAGFRFCKIGLKLLNHIKLDETRCNTIMVFNACTRHWKDHIRDTLPDLKECYQIGLSTGYLEYAGYCLNIITYHSLFAGKELLALKEETEKFCNIISKYNLETSLYHERIFLQTVLNLTNNVENPTHLQGNAYNEANMLNIHINANDLGTLYHLYTQKLFLCYFFHDYYNAIEYFETLEKKYLQSMPGIFNFPICNFYYALSLIAIFSDNTESQKQQIHNKVNGIKKHLKKWAHYAPMNHLHKYLLVEAELSSVLGKSEDARQLYDQAIKLANEHKFLHEEALSNELAAKFWLAENNKKIARVYMVEAHYCYQLWGAESKVALLEKNYPDLIKTRRSDSDISSDRSSLTRTANHAKTGQIVPLDMITITKSSQAISREINLENLLIKMMEIILENAGAQKGFIILESKGHLLIEASAQVDIKKIEVLGAKPVDETDELSQTIIHYVFRSGENVVFPGDSHKELFSEDPYIIKLRPQSILCTPIRYQDKILGILYLENNLAANAFTEERIEILQIILSQAAISLENAFVYDHLDELVKERTAQLKKAQDELIDNAHKAGMADIATTTLHNVGNILNSVKTSTQMVNDTIKNSSIDGLEKANNLLRENIESIEEFIINSPKGKKLMQYYLLLEEGFVKEHDTTIKHLNRLNDMVSAIEEVILTQQNYAGTASLIEAYDLSEIVEDVLMIQSGIIKSHKITIEKYFDSVPKITVQKTKLVHIIVNLIKNAKEALFQAPTNERCLTFKIGSSDEAVFLKVTDTGTGIAKENLEKIFSHGFTTKEDGHGFGLHSSANYMNEMGGRMWAESEVKTKGSTFILRFPKITRELGDRSSMKTVQNL